MPGGQHVDAERTDLADLRPGRRARAGAKLTSGGSSDSDANDWQVKPSGPAGPTAVITTMPVTKWPSTSRMTADGTGPGGALIPRA